MVNRLSTFFFALYGFLYLRNLNLTLGDCLTSLNLIKVCNVGHDTSQELCSYTQDGGGDIVIRIH